MQIARSRQAGRGRGVPETRAPHVQAVAGWCRIKLVSLTPLPTTSFYPHKPMAPTGRWGWPSEDQLCSSKLSCFPARHGLVLDFAGSDDWKHDGYVHGSVLLYLQGISLIDRRLFENGRHLQRAYSQSASHLEGPHIQSERWYSNSGFVDSSWPER